MKKILTTGLILTCFWANNLVAMTLTEATTGAHRSGENIARNAHRNPTKTLEFFGLKENMTVLEIWPGSRGWYTEVLAPYLKTKGVYYAANFDGSTGAAYFEKAAKKFQQKINASPDIYGSIKLTTLMPPNKLVSAPAETVDLVVTFRNIHNWVNNGIEKAILASAHKALKKNGVLGLVAHRTKDSSVGLESAQTGYLTENQVIALVEEVGFSLEARSEINANPSDSANHPKGVWTLPPMLRLGEVDKEKYLAIGESDRMTLKFIKK